MIMYDHDFNKFLAEALNIKVSYEQLAATPKLHAHFKNKE